MGELALYRKYRSRDFTEVIGQDHVVKTLTSAISSGRLSHAYLFTGPRGVGKTSVARLLARAINCTGNPKPCNLCANCQAAINSSLDVIEIDAASNRSIDAVRDLREKVGLAPTQGAFKIYIVDEVHMLTTEAFNALLKTLEEPPPHAVFVLATTEAHKLPETIISRTQQFNFKPIVNSDIVAHLGRIATQEGIQVQPEALELVAAASRGGFRDAISILDQLAAAGATPITAETVRMLIGHSAPEEIAALSRALAARDTRAALAVTTRLEGAGTQPGNLAVQLADYWRTLLLASAGATEPADETTRKLAAELPPSRIAAVVEALLEVTRSHWPQLALEAAIVQLTAAPQTGTQTSSQPSSTGHGSPGHSQPPTDTSSPVPTAKSGLRENTAPAQPTPNPAQQQPGQTKQPLDAKTAAPAGKTRLESATAQTAEASSTTLWPKVIVLIKSKNNSLGALLQMYPVDITGEEVTIKPRFNFHRDLFLKPANRTTIEAAAAKVYGHPVKISARTDETKQPAKRPKPDPAAELVSSALEILGGEIVE